MKIIVGEREIRILYKKLADESKWTTKAILVEPKVGENWVF
jgi:hypothetical protein